MGSVLDKNSSQVRKRIENHTFQDETGEEYEASEFKGFGDYFRRKKIKLQNLDYELRESASEKPQIFKGIVAHVSGYTQPPLHVLHRELVLHGAGFLQYLDNKTMATHIIASSLPPKKAVEFRRYRIVKPAWVVDSITAGKVLPWSDYRLLDEGPGQNVLKLAGGKVLSQANTTSASSYREQVEQSYYTSQLRAAKNQASQVQPSATSHTTKGSASNSPVEPAELWPDESPMDGAQAEEPDPPTEPRTEPQSALQDVASIARSPKEVSVSEMPMNMTSEEHNAWLLSDPHIRKASSANPEFLKQFYSESRLHHLSAWKAELKSKMQKLANERTPVPRIAKRRPGSRRYIFHVDFDSFFCSVSLKRHPEYLDKPAVVAHGTGNGSEIASCNYPARESGVKNGMWMKKALELCPDLKVLPYDFPAYEDASQAFYEAILSIGGKVQSVSVDEALLDVTTVLLSEAGSDGSGIDEGSIWREQERADQLALELRTEIRERTGCAVSVGIGGNILLAKVALRKAKPAGQHQIKPEEVLDVLGGLEAKELPGVAHSIGGKLEEVGIKLVNDIRQMSKERLTSVLGPKTGERLWEYSRGIDRSEVGDQPPRKSVSAEVSWGIRFISQAEAEEFVLNLCKELERRLLNEQVKGRSLTMKIMRRSLDAPLDPVKHLGHGKCDTFNKSTLFGVATHDAATIGHEAIAVLRSFKFSPGDLRGLGVQMTKLEPIKAYTLGPDGSQKRLAFPSPLRPPTAKKAQVDPIEDGPTPQRGSSASTRDVAGDPIAVDPLTPRKPRSSMVHPAFGLAKSAERDAEATTPLNVAGTQFVLPPNADPATLAELPHSIRARLMEQGKFASGQSRQKSLNWETRPQSPSVADRLPREIDPDVFEALPEDMKAEVLASYRTAGSLTPRAHSPRNPVHHAELKKATTPTKRGGRGFVSARERQRDAEAGLLQTNFLSPKKLEPPQDEEEEDIDLDILAELPADVRREVLEDHRRRRLAQRSRLNINQATRRLQTDADDLGPGGQTKIVFPGRPPIITLSTTGISSLGEVKEMIDAWHSETLVDGPHREDVVVMERYLARVILEERDMEKAGKLIKWLSWIVEANTPEGRGRENWMKAVRGIESEAQKAVHQRGLAAMKI